MKMARVICEKCVAVGCGEWEKFIGATLNGKCDCECHKIEAEIIIDEKVE